MIDADVHRRDSVDQGVVRLVDVRVPAALEALHQVELPQRALEVERLREDLPCKFTQLRHRPRLRQRRRRTCQRMSKRGSSAQTGLSRPSGVRVTRCRNRGTRLRPTLNVGDQVLEGGRLALHDERCPDVDVNQAALGEQR